jgi:hypothetical protein
MKRFIRTTAVVMSLFFLAACNPNAPTTSPGASTATITASPNPVPLVGQGPGTTTITWNTGDGSVGTVYLETDVASGKPFDRGASGSRPVPWIEAGKTYEFRLYAGTEHTKMLAKTTVTAQK